MKDFLTFSMFVPQSAGGNKQEKKKDKKKNKQKEQQAQRKQVQKAGTSQNTQKLGKGRLTLEDITVETPSGEPGQLQGNALIQLTLYN